MGRSSDSGVPHEDGKSMGGNDQVFEGKVRTCHVQAVHHEIFHREARPAVYLTSTCYVLGRTMQSKIIGTHPSKRRWNDIWLHGWG